MNRELKPNKWLQIGWSLQVLAWFLVALWLSWHVLAKFDFFYSAWYDWLNIDQAIQRYGPANELHSNFIVTSDAERIRLFSAIVDSVQSSGEGLKDITYYDAQGNRLALLLTEAEVAHLQDVAYLISRSNVLAVLLALGCSFWLWIARHNGWQPLTFAEVVAGVAIIVVAIASIVMLVGPVEIFYWLHELIFPAEHQWFFYYEESLMSLLMKAPYLFAPIAVCLLGLGLILTAMIWCGQHYFYSKKSM